MGQRQYSTFSANDAAFCEKLAAIAADLDQAETAKFRAEITHDHQIAIDCLVSEMGGHSDLNAVTAAGGA